LTNSPTDKLDEPIGHWLTLTWA